MALCKCSSSLGNTGTPTCVATQGVTVGLIAVPRYDSAGVRNFIDTTDPLLLTQAYWDLKTNDLDPTKRFYPIQNLEEVTSTRAENDYKAYPSKAKYLLQEGIRDFKASIPQTDSVYLGKIKKSRCTKFDIYLIGKDGGVTGMGNTAGKFYGIKVNNASWSAIQSFATNTEINETKLSFEFDQTELDENLRQLTSEDLIAVDVVNLTGLLDVNGVVTAISATSFVIDLAFDYGSVLNKQPMQGVITTNVTLFNVTTALTVAVTSVTPDALIKGRYKVVYPTQASASILRATVVKSGFDFTTVTKLIVTIP